MGILRIMGPKTGDEHLEWDPKDPKSVKAAKKRFESLVTPEVEGEGAIKYSAYNVERIPQRVGTPIEEFDKDAGEIMLVPQMAGG